MRHQFGWDLPPGVSVKDIEEAQGEDIDETEALRLAVGSLLDIVSELALAIARGNKPDAAFTDTVFNTIREHKRQLGYFE